LLPCEKEKLIENFGEMYKKLVLFLIERAPFSRRFSQNFDKVYKGFKIEHFSTLSTKRLWKTTPYTARHRVNRGFSTVLQWKTLWEMWKNP